MRKNSFWEDDAGWATALSLFFFMIFLLLGGIAIDSSRIYQQRTVLMASADSAVLAAVQELPDITAAREAGMRYIEEFFPESRYGIVATESDFVFGRWNSETRSLDMGAVQPDAATLTARFSDAEGYKSRPRHFLLGMFGIDDWELSTQPVAQKLVSSTEVCEGNLLLGNLTDYLLYFGDGRSDANWQSASKGFVGDVAVNGLIASERTSGTFAFHGTIVTNDTTLDGWTEIVQQNPDTAAVQLGQTSTIDALRNDFDIALGTLLALETTPGFSEVDSANLDGLDVTDGEGRTYVIDIETGFSASSTINIFGDQDDLFIFRWDSDPASEELNGTVKFSGGGGIIPRGDLTPSNFIHLAGGLNASGGGSNPGALEVYLQDLPEEAKGGGFFTGYWLTTGDPEKNFESSSFSNAIFVGGWYSTARKFSMTSGTSGVHVAPVVKPNLGACDTSGNAKFAGSSRLVR